MLTEELDVLPGVDSTSFRSLQEATSVMSEVFKSAAIAASIPVADTSLPKIIYFLSFFVSNCLIMIQSEFTPQSLGFTFQTSWIKYFIKSSNKIQHIWET